MSLKKLWVGLFAVVSCGFAAGCAGSSLPQENFQNSLAPPDRVAAVEEYRISPRDRLSIAVFPAKDFSVPAARVDASGYFLMPPIGAVQASGKTGPELAREIETKLGSCCLQKPQVVVLVEETMSQQITITGAVVASDVYNLRGPTTLLQAITMAKGPDRTTANLKRVAVYRMSNGQRTGALFDVEAIRDGNAEDPQVFGGDTIIVDSSKAKSAWRTAVSVVPFFGVFTAF